MSDLDQETKKLIAEAAHGYLEEMKGNFCQCDEPIYGGPRGSLCFGCGLVNSGRKHEIGRAMQSNHPFEQADPDLNPGLFKADWCGFCSFPRHDQRHVS